MAQAELVSPFRGLPPLSLVLIQMQIGQAPLMTDDLLVVLLYLLDQTWSPGVPENKPQCQGPVLRLNTKP